MKSDLLSILRTLTQEENRRFGLFLESSYHPHSGLCAAFFKELSRFYPTYLLDTESKKLIFKSIYGSETFKDSTYRGLVRNLMLSLMDFLLVEEHLKPGVNKELNITKILNERNVTGVVNRSIQEIDQMVESAPNCDLPARMLNLYNAEILKYNFYNTHGKVLHLNEAENTFIHLNSANLKLSLYYFIEMVSNSINIKIQQKMYKQNTPKKYCIIDIDKLPEYDCMFPGTPFEYAYNIYRALLVLFYSETSKEHFLKYKLSVQKASDKLSNSELLQHYKLMISFCIQNKSDIPELTDELWRLYQLILDKELFLEGNSQYIDTYLFRSIIILGLRLGYYSEVRSILNKFSIYVHPNDSMNLENLGYAYYYYYTGNYDKALKHTSKVELNDFTFKYDLKNLLVRIYFETAAFEQLSSITKCYREFLRNDKLQNPDIKDSFRHFLNYTELLTKQMNDKDKTEIMYTYSRLQKSKKVYAKEWLTRMYQNIIAGQKSEAYA